MVKKLCIMLMFLLAAFPAIASAGNFTATVDSSSVAAGESFTLELALSNAEAKSAPDTDPLNTSFIVASQGQSSNTTIINGSVTTSTGWELTLIPRTEGKVTIPALSIETSDGTLSTQPITIDVGKASALPSASQNGQTTITASVSTLNPYKDQPLFYTVRIVARANVADLSLGDLSVNNAIVQSQGKPKIYDKVENGEPVKVIEARYIITPLAAGNITIPAILLQGKVAGAGRDLSDDALDQAFTDPFGMLRHMDMFAGFANYKPFSIASNEVRLDVKPAAVAMDPWLPLTSLTITEDWDSTQIARVGEPLTRKITLTADGAIGTQLPGLEPQQNHTDFKVYADRPVTKENVSGETIIGMRKESYSLIPLNAGKLVLPEIKVPWWDIRSNRIAYATLPPRTLEVLPALAVQGQASAPATLQTAPAQEQQVAAPAQVLQPGAPQRTSWKNSSGLYAVIGVLSLVLLFALLWAMRLQRKVSSLSETGESDVNSEPVITQAKRHPLDTRNLATIKTAQELNNFVRDYAHDHWGARKNTLLEAIFSDMVAQNRLQKEATDSFVNNLTASLYAGKEVDLEKLKEQCDAVIGSVRQAGNDNVKLPEKLPRLNPS